MILTHLQINEQDMPLWLWKTRKECDLIQIFPNHMNYVEINYLLEELGLQLTAIYNLRLVLVPGPRVQFLEPIN